jgi:predicted O-methyltransferase YrrM
VYSKNPLSESDLLTKLHAFSEDTFWINLSSEETRLFSELENLKNSFHFPAVKNDVGQLLNFLVQTRKPKTIFEFGSGYGHSAFWYLAQVKNLPQKIYLTEKRTDLVAPFEQLSWPELWKKSLDYFQGDAFERLAQIDYIDLALVDGQKADYLSFIQKIEPKLNSQSMIVIDNAFIKGIFLQEENQNKEVVKKTLELFEFIKGSNFVRAFLPVRDGIILLQKN